MRTRDLLVPFVLCAMGVLSLVLSGCRKEEAKPEIPASSPQSYMHDEAFRKTLAERRKVAYSIGADRAAVEERMNEMRRIIGGKLKTQDRAAVEAALAENAEWKALQSKAKELDAAFERHRKETLGLVRERIAPGRSGKDSASPLGSGAKERRSGKDSASLLGSGAKERRSGILSASEKAEARSTADKEISK